MIKLTNLYFVKVYANQLFPVFDACSYEIAFYFLFLVKSKKDLSVGDVVAVYAGHEKYWLCKFVENSAKITKIMWFNETGERVYETGTMDKISMNNIVRPSKTGKNIYIMHLKYDEQNSQYSISREAERLLQSEVK